MTFWEAMLTFKFKLLGHGPTVKIGQVCEQTELMILVRVQTPIVFRLALGGWYAIVNVQI